MSKNIYRILVLITVSQLVVLGVPQRASAISGSGVVALMNQHRAGAGLAGLSWRGELANSAVRKANDICAKQYWGHTSPDGTTTWQLISMYGYPFVTAAENLAKGYISEAGVVSGWMGSPGHRANILNPAFTDSGVGSAVCQLDGQPTTVVVAHLGATAAKPVAPPPPPTTTTPPKPVAPTAPRAAPTAPLPSNAQTASQPEPAADETKALAKPADKTTEAKPTESFGAKIWRLSQQKPPILFID